MNKSVLLSLFSAVFLLSACRSAEDPVPEPQAEAPVAAPAIESEAPAPAESAADDVIGSTSFEGDAAAPAPAADPDPARLAEVLAAQPEDAQARFVARNPEETLLFFGIAPGMTVVEALPGGGWYTRILMPYLGADGTLVGANYPANLFEQFGFATEEFMAEIATWLETFPAQALDWCSGDCPSVRGFFFGSLPDEWHDSADAVLFIRALHNMARFQDEGIDDFLDQAFVNAFDVLKPGGVLGIVQHEAPADADEGWANGAAGYLKRDFVIARAEAAGFEFEAASDINANPADQPETGDVVWRLAPTLGTTEEGTDERATMAAIGESNRMTLKFRKPSFVGEG